MHHDLKSLIALTTSLAVALLIATSPARATPATPLRPSVAPSNELSLTLVRFGGGGRGGVGALDTAGVGAPDTAGLGTLESVPVTIIAAATVTEALGSGTMHGDQEARLRQVRR